MRLLRFPGLGREESKVCWPLKFSDNKLATRGREVLAVLDTKIEVLRD